MARKIVFLSGQELAVAAALDDVMLAAARPDAAPVALESAVGARLLINWDHVAYATEIPEIGPGSFERRRAHVF